MTVSVQTTYNQFTGNGVTTVFPYQFKILSSSDLQVYVAGVLKALNVDYSVSGVGVDTGGSVTFLLGAPAGATTVSIIRAMTVRRTTDYQQLGDFLTPVVNPDFDNAVLLIQDVQTQLGRSIRTPPDEVGTLPTLPSIISRVGKYISFDSAGLPIASSGTGNDSALRTDLASSVLASDGARLVGVRHTATGAVARTVASKLGDILNAADLGVVGNGVADDSAAITALIATGRSFDLGALTPRIVTKLVFNQANQRIFASGGGGFKFDGSQVSGATTTRLMDVTAAGVEFYNVDFDGNQKQVKGALIYIASNTVRPKFMACRFRRVYGAHVGGTTENNSNFQYAVLISPYGVENFEFGYCTFDDIKNDNAGANGAPTPISGCGFAGGFFFLTDDWALPVTPQTIPTSGTIHHSLFKSIITVLPGALTQADQQNFMDADAIRYFGDQTAATRLHVKVTDCLFWDCGKRAIKNSSSSGTMGNNLTIVSTTALQYPMVTAIKVDGDDQVYTNVNCYSPSTQRLYNVIQSHDCKNLRVANVNADRCNLLWNLAPIFTTTVSEGWRVSNICCKDVSEGGIYPTSNCDRYVDVVFDGVCVEAPATVHNLPAVRVIANTDRIEIEFRNMRILNGDVKLAGYGWTLRNIYHEINDAAYTGFSAGVGVLEAGLDPANAVTRDSVLDNYQLNIKALPNGYLTAGRTYIWLLYGQRLKANGFRVVTPNALATTFSHGTFGGGNDTEISDFTYDGQSFINFGTLFAGPHRRMNMRGARRIGNTTAAQNFLQVDHGQDCELADIYDGRDCAAFGSIIIVGGTISGGHAKAYIIDSVRSMTTAANVVTDGGAKALQVDVNKF